LGICAALANLDTGCGDLRRGSSVGRSYEDEPAQFRGLGAGVDQGVWVEGADGNRRAMRWERPSEFRHGWTHGPVIGIPRVDGKHDLPVPIDSEFDGVTWLPVPAIGNIVMVSLLFANQRTFEPGELGHETVIGGLPLRGGKVVWVVALERTMTPDERAGVLGVRDRELGIGALKGPTCICRGQDWGSVVWTTTSPGGPPMLVQIAVGSHNFEAPLVASHRAMRCW
jgi:hypothetical protein